MRSADGNYYCVGIHLRVIIKINFKTVTVRRFLCTLVIGTKRDKNRVHNNIVRDR